MSRLCRYKESLNRFINDRSCLFNKDSMPNANVNTIIYNKVKNSDLVLPIMLLTIMNNQNKKNSKTIQGYYAASSIQIVQILLDIMENESNSDINHITREYLLVTAIKSLHQNLETVKDNFSGDLSADIIINSLKIYHERVSYSNIMCDYTLEVSEDKPCSDVKNWYIRDDKSLASHFNNLKTVTKKSFKEYVNKKIGSLCELAFQIGWIIGCGSSKDIKKINKVAKSFCYIYKLSHDFEHLEDDIRSAKDGVTKNFVVNYGLQNSYEIFMDNKQKFIEHTMGLNIFTTTIKEILNYIESKVDAVIDETSPDLKSNYSNVESMSIFQ